MNVATAEIKAKAKTFMMTKQNDTYSIIFASFKLCPTVLFTSFIHVSPIFWEAKSQTFTKSKTNLVLTRNIFIDVQKVRKTSRK